MQISGEARFLSAQALVHTESQCNHKHKKPAAGPGQKPGPRLRWAAAHTQPLLLGLRCGIGKAQN